MRRLEMLSGRSPRTLALAGVVSAALLAVVTLRTPQGLFSDPAWQVRAVQQFLRHESPTPNTLTTPDPLDLSRDLGGWIAWWAPGTPILVYPLMANGLAPGPSVRVLTIVFIVLGAIGWARWVACFELPPMLGMAIAAAMPWLHYASAGLFTFSAEALVFGAMPWAVLAVHWIASRWSSGRAPAAFACACVGLLAGSAYVLKYSTALATVGLLAYLGWVAWKARGRTLAGFACVTAAFALPVLALSMLNHRMGGAANFLTETWTVHVEPLGLLGAFGAPVVIAADLEAILRYALMHPAHALVADDRFLLLAGIPGGLLFIWIVMRERAADAARTATLFVLASTVLSLAALWIVSPTSHEARHAATAGLMALPLGIRAGLRAWQSTARWGRWCLLAALAIYVVLPAGYGVASVVAKLPRTSAYRTGPSGVYNPLFAARDAASCRQALVKDFDATRDIWYLTEPITALDLPGRALMVHADFLPAAALDVRYRSSRPLRVVALLPGSFEANGKGPLIRASFAQAGEWTRGDVPHCAYVRWTATVKASVVGGGL